MACFSRCAPRASKAYRLVLGIVATTLLQVGCCSVHISTAGSKGGLGSACGPKFGCESGAGCGVAGCGGACQDFGGGKDPLFDGTLRHRVKHKIASCASGIACAGGCGEVYVDEAINDPHRCDPCDASGNWTGEAGGCLPWYGKLGHLWGIPYQGGDCSQGSCLSGGCVGKGFLGGLGHHGRVVYSRGSVAGTSTCASCQGSRGGFNGGGYEGLGFEEGALENGVPMHDGVIYEGSDHGGSGAGVMRSEPTPATRPAVPVDGSAGGAGSSAQNRIRLHQRTDRGDPNGKLSVQLVNGQRRLVAQPQ